MNWAILKYESGRHAAIPNSLCRLGIPCVLPMVEEMSLKDKRKITRPALQGSILFMPALEDSVRLVLDRVQYAEKVWRFGNGVLASIHDDELQEFLNRLEKRGKKAKAAKSQINLAEAAELDWFMVYMDKFGLPEAMKRFGTDLRKKDVA